MAPKSPDVAVDVGPASPHAEGAGSRAWATNGGARSPRLPAALHGLLPSATSIHLLWRSLPVSSRALLLLWGAAGVAAAAFAITQLAAVRQRGTGGGGGALACMHVDAEAARAGSIAVQAWALQGADPCPAHLIAACLLLYAHVPHSIPWQAWAAEALQDALLILLTACTSLGLLLDGYSRENAYQLVACLGLSGLQACQLAVYLVGERWMDWGGCVRAAARTHAQALH